MVNDLQCSSMSYGSEIMVRSHCSLMKCCKNRFEAGMPLPRFFWSILNIALNHAMMTILLSSMIKLTT